MAHYDIERFISAQERDYDIALAEIKSGKKRSHWMWYIFPLLKELGYSSTAKFYGIENIEEAKAFLEDDYLGGNLMEISSQVLALNTDDIEAVFGYPDYMKL